MFQNKGFDAAYYYCGSADGGQHSGMFLKGGTPSSAYYGFWAFGQLYELGEQVSVSGYSPDDLYAVAAKGENGQALLIANVSEKRDRILRLDAGNYTADKCMTVNEACEWVEIPLPEKIESGSMLFITFKEGAAPSSAPVC